MTQSTDTDLPAAADPATPPQPAPGAGPAAAAARTPFGIDFDELARQIRANERRKTVPDQIHRFFADAAADIRAEIPDLDPQQIGRVLLSASVLTAFILEGRDDWTARSVGNFLASVGERVWHTPAKAPDTQPPAGQQPDTDPPDTLRARLAHSLGLGRHADQDAQEDPCAP